MEASACKECGTLGPTNTTNTNHDDDNLRFHVELESLRTEMVIKDHHIDRLESSFYNKHQLTAGENTYLKEELESLTDKYERLLDAHRRVQKVNQNLEDKLLKIANQFETERSSLTEEISDLTQKLRDAKVTVESLVQENDEYRDDCSLAVHLLQCKPSNFLSHRLDSLPVDIQQRLRPASSSSNPKSTAQECEKISVSIASFPPTAMVFSVPKKVDASASASADGDGNSTGGEFVTTADVARVLRPSAGHRSRVYLCKKCKEEVLVCERGVQTSEEV